MDLHLFARPASPITTATVNPLARGWSWAPTTRPSIGVLFCHGFTGSPVTLNDWAHAVAQEGYAVSVPRLPGHGTSWQEMCRTEWTDWYAVVEREYRRLADTCDRVVVAGLSMGGALAVRLAEREDPAGLILVNPALATAHLSYALLPVLKHVLPAISSIGGDIALEGADEVSYDHTPLGPAASMVQLWRDVRAHLTDVEAPVLLFTSRVDHVVDPASARLLTSSLPGVDHRFLDRSFHVATLDYDAPEITRTSLEFLRSLTDAT